MTAPHRLDIRVYYEDTDFSGFVYHASYIRFLERGRTEFLRSLGMTQSSMQRDMDGLVLVVGGLKVDYLRPARMDDFVTVETQVGALRRVMIRLDQTIVRDDTRLVKASVDVVAVRDGRAVRLPEVLTQLAPA